MPAQAERIVVKTAGRIKIIPVAELQYVEAADGRRLNFMLIYPAAEDSAAALFRVFLSINLQLSKDAPIAPDGLRRPLVVGHRGKRQAAPAADAEVR